jgi:hypothetical protein
MWVTLNTNSDNLKTGPIVVSTTEKDSCPKECALHKECYARFSFLGGHWKKIGQVIKGKRYGDNWDKFCERLKKVAKNKLFRHNQAGDLPKLPGPYVVDKIDRLKLRQLVNAAKKLRGFTYTHFCPKDSHNRDAIQDANKSGFVINLSSNNLTEADEYANLGIGPVVTIVPLGLPALGLRTPEGRTVVICPAQRRDDVTCESCKLCAVGNRKSVVGFYPHGVSKKKLSAKADV